jgi:cell division protein FtsL
MQVIGMILLYVVVASIMLVVYFNHLTAQQKKEMNDIVAANRLRITAQIQQKEQELERPELAQAV